MAEKNKSITYTVNGDEETTAKVELSVGEILENAGFTPMTDFELKSDDPKQNYGDHYDEVIKLHNNMRFTALHKGPTPTS